MLRKRLLTVLPFILLAGGVWLLPLDWLAAAPQTRQVTLTASQFAFDPPILHVNRGDRVILTLQAADVVHGLYLDGYDLQARVEPGLPRQLEFIADRSGKFRYRCSVSCGSLHPFMIGELVVTPNDTFIRLAGLALITAAGVLTYLRRCAPGAAYG